MYAESPRLGALGSGDANRVSTEACATGKRRDREHTLLLLLSARLSLAGGGLFLRHIRLTCRWES